MIAIDLAVRRPDLVRAVIEHEGPWRFTRHLPTVAQVGTFARIGSLVLRGRPSDAAEALLRSAYTLPRRRKRVGRLPRGVAAGRQGERQGDLVGLPHHDRQLSIRGGPRDRRGPRRVQLRRTEPRHHGPPARDRSPLRSPTARTHRIEGAAHAAPFDATDDFVQLIADTMREWPFVTDHVGSPEGGGSRATKGGA